MKNRRGKVKGLELRVDCEVARLIRQHARSSSKAEICGVLIGSNGGGFTAIDASIPGANAVQGGTHVTFTQETWEHIYRVKDRDHPNARIVGWYHSHPGFGVFLSDHDTFIHKNFFSAEHQVAWVYDPHSDEEGCFGWVGDRIERLTEIVFVDSKGGEGAGETGKPEPLLAALDHDDLSGDVLPAHIPQADSLLGTLSTVATYLIVFLIGALLSWYFFPRLVPIPVDPATGEPLLNAPMDTGKPAQGAVPSYPAVPSHPAPAAQPETATPAPSNSATKPAEPGTKGNR